MLNSVVITDYIISNKSLATNGKNLSKTVSIKAFYERRFGTNNPTPTLPVEKD